MAWGEREEQSKDPKVSTILRGRGMARAFVMDEKGKPHHVETPYSITDPITAEEAIKRAAYQAGILSTPPTNPNQNSEYNKNLAGPRGVENEAQIRRDLLKKVGNVIASAPDDVISAAQKKKALATTREEYWKAQDEINKAHAQLRRETADPWGIQAERDDQVNNLFGIPDMQEKHAAQASRSATKKGPGLNPDVVDDIAKYERRKKAYYDQFGDDDLNETARSLAHLKRQARGNQTALDSIAILEDGGFAVRYDERGTLKYKAPGDDTWHEGGIDSRGVPKSLAKLKQESRKEQVKQEMGENWTPAMEAINLKTGIPEWETRVSEDGPSTAGRRDPRQEHHDRMTERYRAEKEKKDGKKFKLW